MFVGHFAVAFVGKRIDPKLSLGTLLLASMLPDLLWPIFSIAGVEYRQSNFLDVPISHSLLMVAVWAAALAGGYFLLRHYPRGALMLFAAVVSHWLLDFMSHRHALAPGLQAHYGLELWNSLPATVIVEGGFWLLAIILYVRATRVGNRAGVYAFWPVVIFLTYAWITNTRKGPPPREAVIGSLIFFLLLIAWAYWMNRARRLKVESKAAGY